MKGERKKMQEENKTKQIKAMKRNDIKDNKAITLVALVVTVIVNRVFYDKNKKYSNLVGSNL